MILALVVSLAVGCADTAPSGLGLLADISQQRDTTLLPAADTYIRQGSPNQNQGGDAILRLQSSGHNRALIRFDQSAIAAVVSGGSLVAARLEVTITDNGENWGTSGRPIALHRLTQPWTELGATWNCAIDDTPANQSPDCSGVTQWEMGSPASANPFAPTSTATAVIHNDQGGVVSFDVTADVASFLAGSQANNGWVLKKVDEGQNGRVAFASRESSVAGRLRMTMAESGDTTRPQVPIADFAPSDADSQRIIVDPTDSSIAYYRELFDLQFDDSTSGPTVRAFFARYNALVIGGIPAFNTYVIRVPDPGAEPADYDSLLARMARESGVLFVAPIAHRSGTAQLEGRFPLDGVGMVRSDWFAAIAGPGTWSRLSVRAPLAWGCENGNYGGPFVRIGVIDYIFDRSHPDLAPNLGPSHPIPLTVPTALNDSLTTNAFRNHGTAVAGVLGAVGDNGIGVAGIMWGAELHLFEMSRGNTTPNDQARYLARVLSEAAASGVRILSVSMDVPLGGGQAAAQRRNQIESRLREYTLNGGVLVYSLGNDAVTASLSDWAEGAMPKGVFGLRAAIAHLRLDATAGKSNGRIITVAGTRRDNSFAPFSNFMLDGTDIAAPAESILTIGHTSYSSGAMSLSGTSFAAPLVAGAAGLLVAMLPSLNLDSIKDYIVRGSRAARPNVATGAPERSPVANAPETVHELDVYGALKLLSSERPGTPICGFPVSMGFDENGSVDGTVLLERQVGNIEIIQVPGGHTTSQVSVAQGGRLLSVFDSYAPTESTFVIQSILMDQLGNSRGFVPDAFRRYLERDTLDQLWANTPYPQEDYVLRASDPARSRAFTANALVTGAHNPQCGTNTAVAPDGLRVHVGIFCQDQSFVGQYVVVFDSAAVLVSSEIGQAAWSHDSRRFGAVVSDASFSALRMEMRSASGTLQASAPLTAFSYVIHGFDGPDVLFQTQEIFQQADDCLERDRTASNLLLVRSAACMSFGGERREFPNVMAAGVASRPALRSSGFSLAEPARLLERRRTLGPDRARAAPALAN